MICNDERFLFVPPNLDLCELGNSCKLSCELSARVKPTLSDVKAKLSIPPPPLFLSYNVCFVA